MTFDPRLICSALNAHGVRYVVVGGFAAVIHGSPLPTADIDIVPDRSEDNLERLARALRSIGATLRTAAGPIAAPIDRRFLADMAFMLNLATDHGDLDLTFEPAGPRRTFDDWDQDGLDVAIAEDLVVRVAHLDAVIDSKRATGRVKDERALPYLESLRDELNRHP